MIGIIKFIGLVGVVYQLFKVITVRDTETAFHHLFKMVAFTILLLVEKVI